MLPVDCTFEVLAEAARSALKELGPAQAANDEKRSAVERQVFISGEAAARLPEEWKLRRPQVPWRKIVWLRNLLAHGYWVIDAEELSDVARDKVPEFVAELRPLLGDTE